MTDAAIAPGHPVPTGLAPVPRARTALPPLVAIYLVCIVVPVTMNVGPIYLTGLRVLLLALVIPLTLRLLTGGAGRVGWPDVLLLLHGIWIFVALAVNNPDRVVQQAPSVIVEFLGGYLVARIAIRTPAAFEATMRFVVALVLCLMPFAVLEAVTGEPLLVRAVAALPAVGSIDVVTIEGRLGLERVQATFQHPIHFGLFCSVAFSMAFVGLEGVYGGARRWLTSIAVAGCGFLALSSGALLAIALQIGLIVWSALLPRMDGRWWLLAGLGALAYVAVDLLSNRTPVQVFLSYATFSSHTAYWRSIILDWGLRNVAANPLFGIGLNDWERPYYMYSGSMDNFWLVMAVRYGVPGFATVALAWLLVMVGLLRRPFARDSRLGRQRRAMVFTLLGLSFTLITVHVWTNIYSFTFFLMGAGIWMLTWDEAENGGGDPDARPATPHPTTAFTRQRRRHVRA